MVKDLYTDATTAIQHPGGQTPPITINRGTIQGDSLSPYLFIVYLEPLLRWLRVGGRGYQHQSLHTHEDRIRYQTSDCTYADDLNVITTTVPDMAIQAQKLTEFANWAHLKVNMDKSTITAALHQQNPQAPYDKQLIHRRLNATIALQGQPVQVHDPKKDFRYLGVHLTMDLNWTPQLKNTLDKLRDKINHLGNSWLTYKQQLHILKTCIRPMVAYPFIAAPYLPHHIKLLDSQICNAVKRALRIGKSTSNAFIHQAPSLGGLGHESLRVEYATI